jgi:MoaA/NifB/PqqE/SkfB family radical SAM enzyme
LYASLERARSIAIRSLTPNRPYHAQWMLTKRCNFRCKGCNVWREQDSNELSTREVKAGLDALRQLGLIEVVLSGGNPLLREDIGEIIEYSSRFFITTVYDNGSMAVEKISVLRHADLVAISIDSLDPKKNDYIRGVRGAWQNAMNAVEVLREKGISVGVAPTISQFNLYELLDFTKYFVNKGIPVWYSLYSYDSPVDQAHLFKIGREDDEFVIADRKGIVAFCDSLIKLKKRNSNILMTAKLLRAIKDFYLTGKRSWECRALQNFFMIDHAGRVSGCHLHGSTATIFDLHKLWNSPKLDELRETYKKCTKCTYLCYIFYSMYGSVLGNLQIALDGWRNAKILLKKTNPMLASLPKQ